MLLPPASHSAESHRTTLSVNFADALCAMNPAFIAHRSLAENPRSIANKSNREQKQGLACGSPELDQVGQLSMLKATSAFVLVLLTKFRTNRMIRLCCRAVDF